MRDDVSMWDDPRAGKRWFDRLKWDTATIDVDSKARAYRISDLLDAINGLSAPVTSVVSAEEDAKEPEVNREKLLLSVSDEDNINAFFKSKPTTDQIDSFYESLFDSFEERARDEERPVEEVLMQLWAELTFILRTENLPQGDVLGKCLDFEAANRVSAENFSRIEIEYSRIKDIKIPVQRIINSTKQFGFGGLAKEMKLQDGVMYIRTDSSEDWIAVGSEVSGIQTMSPAPLTGTGSSLNWHIKGDTAKTIDDDDIPF